jgi:photoactive yellow protein
MTETSLDFESSDLAVAAERLTQYELDRLPFGAILLDRAGTVLCYSATEMRQSGYSPAPLGLNLYSVSRCLNSDDFRGRIERAMEAGPVDLEIGWYGDFADPDREMRIRVLSARTGGVWIFVQREGLDEAASGPPADDGLDDLRAVEE